MRVPSGEVKAGDPGGCAPIWINIPSAHKAALVLMGCVVFLHAANLARILIHWKTGHGYLGGLMPLFNVDHEGNAPSLYSVVALALASGLAAVIALRERQQSGRFWKHWVGIAAGFAWVALDEGCRIHELTMPLGGLIARSGIFFFSWVIPAMLVLAVLVVAYFRMIFSLPPWLRNLAILSAGVYLSGAIGMEMVGGMFWEKSGPDIPYQLVCALEEFLEKTGVIIWIYALLRYLTVDGAPCVLCLRFPSSHKV